MADHTVTVPQLVWEWAQRKSGKSNPASFLREALYAAVIADYVKESAAAAGNVTNGHAPEHAR